MFVLVPISFSSGEYLEFPPPGYSLRWYKTFFGEYEWLMATQRSFLVAVLTTLLATFLGTLSALAFARGNLPGKDVIYALLLSPMIIPLIVISVAIYAFFSRLGIVGTTLGLVIGHTIIACPFVFVTVSAALSNYNMEIEYASLSLGANRLITFFRVTLPIIKAGVFSGALFAFIISFDEIVIAMFISGWKYTLPVKMWQDLRSEINPTIAAVSTMLICLSSIIFTVISLYQKKE
jgi:ABC-type spermidine/putrescine transport system permease subunit II